MGQQLEIEHGLVQERFGEIPEHFQHLKSKKWQMTASQNLLYEVKEVGG